MVRTIKSLRSVRAGLFKEIDDERARQDQKWGEQNHPDVDPVLMARPRGCPGARMALELEVPTAPRAKYLTDKSANDGQCCFARIAIEELAEAVEAATQHTQRELRVELIQCAAVFVQWIEALDRREERRSAR